MKIWTILKCPWENNNIVPNIGPLNNKMDFQEVGSQGITLQTKVDKEFLQYIMHY
jgi:hypothetical protein